MNKTPFETGTWTPFGQEIQVAGITIPGGMVYLGTSLKTINNINDPCLIDPTMPVSSIGKFTKKKVGPFPNYSNLSSEARRVYLNWLAGNRVNPRIDIGYVLLFLYGLERRLVFDVVDESIYLQELPLISNEIHRLINIYGNTSTTFASCAVEILNWIDIPKQEKIYSYTIPFFPKTHELPLYLKVALGQAAKDRAVIPLELAISWAKLDPRFGISQMSPERTELFRRSFTVNYENKFGNGILIRQSKTPLKFSYDPCSIVWRNSSKKINYFEVSDISKSLASFERIKDIVSISMKEVENIEKLKISLKTPFSNIVAPSIPKEDRLIIIDGRCFQYPEYQNLPKRSRGHSAISDLLKFNDTLFEKIPSIYAACLFKEPVENQDVTIIRLMSLLGWNVIVSENKYITNRIISLAKSGEYFGKKVEILTHEKELKKYLSPDISVTDPVSGKRHHLTALATNFNTYSKKYENNSSKHKSQIEDISNFKFLDKNEYGLSCLYEENNLPHHSLSHSINYIENWSRAQISNAPLIKNNKKYQDSPFVVYRIRNKSSKKLYFGSTSDLQVRWRSHQREISNGTHPNPGIREDANLFGLNSFEIKIVSRHEGRSDMLHREQLLISMFHGRPNCYNYREFVDMQNGLISCIIITARYENIFSTEYKKMQKMRKNSTSTKGKDKGYGSYISIHAASKDIGVTKQIIKSALLENLMTPDGWKLTARIILKPNEIEYTPFAMRFNPRRI